MSIKTVCWIRHCFNVIPRVSRPITMINSGLTAEFEYGNQCFVSLRSQLMVIGIMGTIQRFLYVVMKDEVETNPMDRILHVEQVDLF